MTWSVAEKQSRGGRDAEASDNVSGPCGRSPRGKKSVPQACRDWALAAVSELNFAPASVR